MGEGAGEQNLRDAQYETEAVLDHYFYHDNVAPFLCIRIMQRFSFSMPSPRFVGSCAKAFKSGTYISGGITFGSGVYGSLEAMTASILLDREATEYAVTQDPSHGSIREPVLKLTNILRSMEYKTHIPTTLGGPPLQTNYNLKIWYIADKIGNGPHDFPSVFSCEFVVLFLCWVVFLLEPNSNYMFESDILHSHSTMSISNLKLSYTTPTTITDIRLSA